MTEKEQKTKWPEAEPDDDDMTHYMKGCSRLSKRVEELEAKFLGLCGDLTTAEQRLDKARQAVKAYEDMAKRSDDRIAELTAANGELREAAQKAVDELNNPRGLQGQCRYEAIGILLRALATTPRI